MTKFAAPGAALATAVLGLVGSGAASAATTTYDITNDGAVSKVLSAEENCTQIVVLFTFQDCTYGGTRLVRDSLFGWVGPPSNGGFYPNPSAAQAIAYTILLPDPNQADVPLTGTITVDDNGTPGDPTDDKISADLFIAAATRNVFTGNGDKAVEYWDQVEEAMAPVSVNPALTQANGAGGVDYYISTGASFPTRLHHTQGFGAPPAGAADTDTDYPSSGSPGSLGDVYWDLGPGPVFNSPSPAGIERAPFLGGNAGGTTTATITNFTCVDNAGDNDCTTSVLLWTAPLAPGSTVAAQGAGWTNVILKLSTDSSGAITSAFGYYTREFRIANGSNSGLPTDLNSWQGGSFTFTGQKQIPAGAGAQPDTYKVRQGSTQDLDVTSNDNSVTAGYTLALVGAASCGTATVTGSPQVIHFVAPGTPGSCTFTYSLTSAGIPDTQALVTVNVLGNVTLTSPATVNGDTKGKVPSSLSLQQDVKQAPVSTTNLIGTPVVAITTQGTKGTASVTGTKITYVPSGTFFQGTDTVSYTVTDTDSQQASGQLSINIPNVTPTAGSASYTLNQGENKAVDVLTVSGSAAGNGAPPNHVFAITVQPTAGTATITGSTITYTTTSTTAPGDYTVQYTIQDGDGETSAAGTLTYSVNSKTVVGGGPQLPGGSATDPLTLALLGLGIPVARRRRRR